MSTWKTASELMQVRYKVQAEIGIRVLRGTCMMKVPVPGRVNILNGIRQQPVDKDTNR